MADIFRNTEDVQPVDPESGSTGSASTEQLVKWKQRIARYVRVFSTEGIRVKYKSQMKNPGGTTPDKVVYLTGDIDEKSLDAVIGTAIHEAAHIKWTDLMYWKNIQENPKRYIPSSVVDRAEKRGEDMDFIRYAFKTLVNIIEDRRIDSMTYGDRPGWRKYVMYRYNYWYFTDEINENLNKEDGQQETWNCYLFQIANIFNPHIDLDSMDKLRDIFDAIGLDDIERLESVQDSGDVAAKVMHLIMDAVDEVMDDFEKQPQQGGGEGDNMEIKLPGLGEDAEEDFNQQLDIANEGEEKGNLSDDQKFEIETAENDDVDNVSVGDTGSGTGQVQSESPIGRATCRVVHRVTQQMIDYNNYCFTSQPKMADAVEEGARQGSLLARRLKVRDERHEHTSRRNKRGGLDGRLVAEIGFNGQIFKQTQVEEYQEAFLHMSIDASGSMRGEGWTETIKTATAIAVAANILESVQCQISTRFTVNSENKTTALFGNNGKPAIAIVYDSRQDNIRAAKEKLKHVVPGGTTPEGLCYQAVMEKIVKSSERKDAYFINFSDGLPNFQNRRLKYGKGNAIPHTRMQVQQIRRRANAKVISYFIGSSGSEATDDFRDMYGNDSRFIDVTDISSVARTLNKKLLEK